MSARGTHDRFGRSGEIRRADRPLGRLLRSSAIRLLAALVLLSPVCLPAGPAAAQASGPRLAVELERLLAAGEWDAARQTRRRALGSAPDAVLHRGHLEGLILVRQRRYDEAADVFRKVLTLNPDFVPSRVELAKILYRIGDTGAAQHHFRAIELGSDDTGLRRFAQSFLDRMERQRPYGFSGYISLLPSTNINRGTGNETFGGWTIDEASRRKGGVGVAAGLDGHYRWTIDERSGFVLSGAIDAKKYSGASDLDELGLTTSLAYLRRLGGVQLRAGPVAEYRFVAWKPHLARYGVSAGAQVPLGSRTSLATGVSLLRQDFSTQDNRDGWLAYGSATARHMLSPSLGVSVTAGFTVERTRADRLDHNDFRLGFQLDKEWTGGLITSAFASYETHRYLGPFIPGTQTSRRDAKWSLGGRLAHRSLSFRGFAPELKYEFTRQHSNIGFHDYSSHDVGVTLTRRF